MDDGGLPTGALHLDGLVGGEGGVFQGDGVEAGGVLHAVGQRSEVSPGGGFGCLERRMSGWVQRKHQKLGQRVTAGRLVALSESEARHTSHTAMHRFPNGVHHDSSQTSKTSQLFIV